MADKKEKFVTKDQPYITITVRAHRMWREDGTGGVMMLTGPGGVSFEGAESKKEVGHIRPEVAGRALEICDNRRPYDHSYSLDMSDLWEAFQHALDTTPGQELKEG